MITFDRLIANATKQIKATGELVTWLSTGDPIAFDESKPWIQAPSNDTEYQVSIVFLSNDGSPLEKLIAGASLPTSGKRGLMAPVAFTPKLSDKVKRSDGTELAFESINKIDPNGQILLWKLVFKA